MWEDIIRLAVGNGLWAVLSVALLSYLLKDSKRREKKYTDIIGVLAERLKLVEAIKAGTDRIISSLETKTPDASRRKSAKIKTKNVGPGFETQAAEKIPSRA